MKSIEYDPNRSAHIALVSYVTGEKRYIIAPLGLRVGDVVESLKLWLRRKDMFSSNYLPVK